MPKAIFPGVLALVVAAVLAAGAPVDALTRTEALRLFDRAAARLHLTAERRSEIFFLLLRHEAEIRAVLAEEEEARRALREAIAQPAFDEPAIRQRACRTADADLALSLLAARLFAEAWPKLDADQQRQVTAAIASVPAGGDMSGAAARFAGGSDLYLTLAPAPAKQ